MEIWTWICVVAPLSIELLPIFFSYCYFFFPFSLLKLRGCDRAFIVEEHKLIGPLVNSYIYVSKFWNFDQRGRIYRRRDLIWLRFSVLPLCRRKKETNLTQQQMELGDNVRFVSVKKLWSNYLEMLLSLDPLILSLLPLLFLFFLLKWLSSTQPSHKNLPPSLPKLPIIGNLHQLGTFTHRSLHSLAQKYGPLMQLHFGSVPVLVVSSPDAACEIMNTHDIVFSSRPKSTITSKLLYASKDVASAPYGEYWRQMKSLFVLHLLNNKRVQSFRRVREEETALMVGKIEESCRSSSSNSVVNLSEVFVAITNDVVCRVALGSKYGGGKFKDLLGEFGELLGAFDVGDYVPWLAWVNHLTGLYARADKVAKKLDDFLESVVEEHMDLEGRDKSGGEGGKDFVDVLLEIQRNNMAGFPIPRESVKALTLDVFAAGTDTTSTVLEWTMSELLRHPIIMKELQKEVREIGKGKPFLNEDDLEKMHYLKAVMKEALRFHTPLPLLVLRRATCDVKVMGYDIAAGTTVIINAWAIGRDPASWNDDPEEFKPERFLNSSVDFRGHHFQFIPFGAGRRGCPGIAFSMVTNELVLANVVHKFDWKLPDGGNGEDLDMTETTGLALHRKFPLLASATPYTF